MKRKLFTLAVLVVLIAAGCSEIEIEQQSLPLDTNSKTITVNVSSPETRTTIKDMDDRIAVNWKAGDAINLFVVQGGKVFEILNIALTPDPANHKKASFQFNLPGHADFDEAQSFDLYGTHGLEIDKRENGKIWVDIRPRAGTFEQQFDIPMMFKRENIQSDDVSNLTVKFEHLGFLQQVNLTNSSSETLSFHSAIFTIDGIENPDNWWVHLGKYATGNPENMNPPIYDLVGGAYSESDKTVPLISYFQMSSPLQLESNKPTTSLFWAVFKAKDSFEMRLSLLNGANQHTQSDEVISRNSPLATGRCYYVNARWTGNSIERANIRYVKLAANGDGSSWANASGDLKAMINASQPGDQVWVAAGQYPVDGLRMKEGVKIYGGFPDTDNPTWADRDWKENETILDGTDKNVVITNFTRAPDLPLTAAAVLDGFTIANANSAGMTNYSSSPTIANCTFTKNDQAGIFNDNSSPTIINCLFLENIGWGCRGINNFSSSPVITNCSFIFNGDGIENNMGSAPKITNCLFFRNSVINQSCSPTISNCTFVKRSRILNYSTSLIPSSPKIYNTIIIGIEGIENIGGNNHPEVKYSLIENFPDSNPDNGNLGYDNVTEEDLFTRVADSDDYDNSTGDYTLKENAIVIDRGSNALYNEVGDLTNDKDLGGNPRRSGTAIDLGAYERQQ